MSSTIEAHVERSLDRLENAAPSADGDERFWELFNKIATGGELSLDEDAEFRRHRLWRVETFDAVLAAAAGPDGTK